MLTESGRGIPLKRPMYQHRRSVSIDPTVGSRSNVFTSSRRLFSIEWSGIRTTRLRRPVEDIPLKEPQYQLKRSVSIDPTIGSRSNVFTSSRRLFSMVSRGIRTTRRRRLVGPYHPQRRVYRLKRSVSIDPAVGSLSNFFHEFPHVIFDRMAWNHYDSVRSRPFH